jgi:hypothetical protein
VIFATLLAGRTAHLTPRRKELFVSRVSRYASSIQEHGLADFMPTSEQLLGIRRVHPSRMPAMQLRVALHIRNLYSLIFDRLI